MQSSYYPVSFVPVFLLIVLLSSWSCLLIAHIDTCQTLFIINTSLVHFWVCMVALLLFFKPYLSVLQRSLMWSCCYSILANIFFFILRLFSPIFFFVVVWFICLFEHILIQTLVRCHHWFTYNWRKMSGMSIPLFHLELKG